MIFTKDDYDKYKAFKSVIEQGDFEIKGKAVVTVAIVMQWFNALETKIVEDLKPKESSIPKKVKEPITKA